jgi:hypothetical protein
MPCPFIRVLSGLRPRSRPVCVARSVCVRSALCDPSASGLRCAVRPGPVRVTPPSASGLRWAIRPGNGSSVRAGGQPRFRQCTVNAGRARASRGSAPARRRRAWRDGGALSAGARGETRTAADGGWREVSAIKQECRRDGDDDIPFRPGPVRVASAFTSGLRCANRPGRVRVACPSAFRLRCSVRSGPVRVGSGPRRFVVGRSVSLWLLRFQTAPPTSRRAINLRMAEHITIDAGCPGSSAGQGEAAIEFRRQADGKQKSL